MRCTKLRVDMTKACYFKALSDTYEVALRGLRRAWEAWGDSTGLGGANLKRTGAFPR